MVQQRLGTPAGATSLGRRFLPDTYMVIEDARGQVLAGNLPYVQCTSRPFMLALPVPGGHHHPQMVLGRCAPLTAGTEVFVRAASGHAGGANSRNFLA